MPETFHLWRFTDGKRGHENQTRGLLDALGNLLPIRVTDLPHHLAKNNRLNAWLKRFPAGRELPAPHLLVGAGRRTHWPLLAAKRATGVPAVVLMAPSRWLLPWFDLCLVPEHDETKGSNVVTTQGALTAIRPGGEHSDDQGVILIGGPSAHHSWDAASVLENVSNIAREASAIQWKLTTSRRTPAETVSNLASLALPNLEVWPVEKTSPEWVPTELAASRYAWVTEDSVSMVYEAVTSGATSGILPVPRRRENSRVVRGLDRLHGKGYVSKYDRSSPLPAPAERAQLDEAGRCAKVLADRFLKNFTAR